MKKILLLLFLFSSSLVFGQIYIDEFDDGNTDNTSLGNGYSATEADGEWSITGDGTGGPFDLFSYTPIDDTGGVMTLDLTENNKIYVRAKASNLGTSLRMDVKDADGYVSTVPGVTKTLINDYTVFEYDFTGNYVDGGYGGTACATGPCDVDGSRIVEFLFFVNPGIGSWAGTVKLDFISVGTEPQVGPMSDVFQDQFDSDVSLNYMSSPEGYENVINDSKWKIQGNGTNGMWEPVSMLFYNTTTLDTTDVSVGDGDDKIFLRMRTDVPGTSIRMDIQDINDFASTAGSITKVISDEWVTYEFNYAGSYQDLAYGGTGCTVGPCDLDPDRIANMIIFVNPGVEGFVGEVEIEYISVGTALEADAGANDILVYGDHFSADDSYTATDAAYDLSVDNSVFKITGSGVDAPYSAVSYSLHDDTGAIYLNATGNNKMFIKVKSSAANTLMRVDLVDTAGYVTTQPSFARLLDEDYSVLEFDFSNSYIDAGYGGTACEEGTEPCEVNAEAISSVLLYPNPADGGFAGDIEIDYISFGAPMGDDVRGFDDHFDDEDRTNWADAGGFTVTESGTELVIVGDGTAGAYAAFSYAPLDEDGEPVALDLTSNNKLFLKVKSTVDGAPLRIDLVDSDGFASTEPATIRSMTAEYTILEFDYSGTYSDGGYGGTACETGPCPVNGASIERFLVYVDPDNGGYNGTVTIDWFSILEPLETIIDNGGPLGVDNYSDEFADSGIANVTGNDGLAVSVDGVSLSIVGDGTSGLYSPVTYAMHEAGDSIIVNAEANENKIYIRAKSTVDAMPLRIDIVDNMNFHTSQAGLTNNVNSEYEIIEYNFSGNYTDGGYGGTACDLGPCQVDGKRVQGLTLYINPGVGVYDGEMNIDWISFGEPLTVGVVDIDIAGAGKVYPNPFLDELYFDLQTKVSGQMKATIVDLNGKVIKNIDLGKVQTGSNSAKVSLGGIASGMYIINISIDGQLAYNHKIIKL